MGAEWLHDWVVGLGKLRGFLGWGAEWDPENKKSHGSSSLILKACMLPGCTYGLTNL